MGILQIAHIFFLSLSSDKVYFLQFLQNVIKKILYKKNEKLKSRKLFFLGLIFLKLD